MQLYLNATSPFARWILIGALEYEIKDIDLIWVNPWELPAQLCQLNPFATVPLLQLANGQALYESSLIMRYLFPPPSVEAWDNLQRLALGKMLLETAFRYVSWQHVSWQRDQPEDGPVHPLLDRANQTLVRVLSQMTLADLPPVVDRPDLASLQLAVGLDYLAFRCPELITAGLASALHDRLIEYQARSSFVYTKPTALAQAPQSIQALLG
jgi:glutathione S-transferase